MESSHKPRCILLTGPLGAGKTTVAALYGAEHPLSLVVSSDELIVMVSGWLQHEDTALRMAFDFALDMTHRHLQSGHDVVLPYFVHTPDELQAFKTTAQECEAEFYGFFLDIPKEVSVARTLERGSWGELGSPPITTADIPIIESKYDEVLAATASYPSLVRIPSNGLAADETYRKIYLALSE